MTGTYRCSDPLSPWRERQQQLARQRHRRNQALAAATWLAFGFACAWLGMGCVTTNACAYDPECWEIVGDDYTDMGVGCLDDCLAPEDGR